MLQKRNAVFIGIFIALEAVLYWMILTGREHNAIYAYSSIALCFAYGLFHGKHMKLWMLTGMACTLVADFFLVVCTPADQFWGMVFFMAAQSMYAVVLHKTKLCKPILMIRIVITAIAPLIVVVALGDKTDALAVISVCYYANLVMNLITAFAQKKKLLGVAFVLFLLCDTVIGLQVAAKGYLSIEEGSLLYGIIFTNFNLAWLFYLPSQVLIAISSDKV